MTLLKENAHGKNNTKQPSGIYLTQRDFAILHFVNQFGFCEMPHIQAKFNLKRSHCYRITQRLTKVGLMSHERVFFHRPGILRLTKTGAKLTGLPPLKRIPLATYHHNCILIDVYTQLCQQYPQAQWISERHLKYDKFSTGVGKNGHTPDGLLLLPDGKQIAIEVELTFKNRKRLEKIIRSYAAQLKTHEVWYYCLTTVGNSIQQLAKEWPFIKIYCLPFSKITNDVKRIY